MFSLFHRYRHWQYKNTGLLVLSLAVLVLLLHSGTLTPVFRAVGGLGYFGALIAGMLFVSTFTVAPAAVVLFYLAQVYDPIAVSIMAGLGAVVGDYILFRFLRDRVFDEVRPLFARFGGSRLDRLFHTPYFAWFMPVLGAVIIASPLPDEIGVGLLGSTRMHPWQFLALSFLLNTAGVLAVVLTSRLVVG